MRRIPRDAEHKSTIRYIEQQEKDRKAIALLQTAKEHLKTLSAALLTYEPSPVAPLTSSSSRLRPAGSLRFVVCPHWSMCYTVTPPRTQAQLNGDDESEQRSRFIVVDLDAVSKSRPLWQSFVDTCNDVFRHGALCRLIHRNLSTPADLSGAVIRRAFTQDGKEINAELLKALHEQSKKDGGMFASCSKHMCPYAAAQSETVAYG